MEAKVTQPPEPGAQSGTDVVEPPQSGDAPPDGTGKPADDGAQSGSGAGDKTEETVSKADFEALRKRMQAADARAAQREQELRQLKDKDLPEAEKVVRERDEATARAEKAETALRELRIQNAFLKDNTYRWRNPDAALRLADLSNVVISEDGEVTGLKDALKRLANAEPYMLDKDAKEGGSAPPPAGAPTMNGQPTTDQPDTKKMLSRLPAMRTRQRPQ